MSDTTRRIVDTLRDEKIVVLWAVDLTTALTDGGYKLWERLDLDYASGEGWAEVLDIPDWIWGIDRHAAVDAFGEWAASENLSGWLIAGHAPVRTEHGSYSWGHCHILEVRGDTYEQALDALIEEARDRRNAGSSLSDGDA